MSGSLHPWAISGAAESPEPWSPREEAVLRAATRDDAEAILTLINAHREEGHLLARSLHDVAASTPRFLVAEHDRVVVACAELAPLGPALAEVRSLVVGEAARGEGVGRRLIAELMRRAEAADYEQLCAFTHGPAWFCRQGFSIVPHVWLMPKLLADCVHCPLFRRCGQFAVVASIPVRERRCASRAVHAA